jgi:hypothetical protein
MPKESITKVQLITFAEEHLDYEVDMLFQTASELANHEHPQHIRNAILECFTIHLRAPIDFPWERRCTKEDDALAKDYYIDPSEWHGTYRNSRLCSNECGIALAKKLLT